MISRRTILTPIFRVVQLDAGRERRRQNDAGDQGQHQAVIHGAGELEASGDGFGGPGAEGDRETDDVKQNYDVA